MAGLRDRNLISNQFDYQRDQELTPEEASAACGPTAALAFARYTGHNPTIGQALALAKQVGWTPSLGMAGPESEVKLLGQLGTTSQYTAGASPDAIAQEVQAGRPVIVDTPNHYFAIDDYDPKSGAFHVGGSGQALRSGSDWMTWDQISQAGGGARGAIFVQGDQMASQKAPMQAGDPNQQLIQDAIGDPTTGATAPTTASVASTQDTATIQSNPILDEVQKVKGPFTTVGIIGPKTTNDRVFGQQPNLYPTYRYQWSDGTYLDVSGDPTGGAIKGGTALAALKEPSPNASRPTPINKNDPYVWDPTTGTMIPNQGYVQNLVPGDARGGGERDPGTPVDVYNAQTSRQTADTSALNAQTTLGNDTAQRKLDQAKFADAQQQQTVDNALNQAKYQLEVTKNQISLSNLSLSEKQFAYSQAKDKIEQDLARTTQALTQRGQDITTRGQNLSMATQLGSDASQATTAALPYLAPAGTGAALSRAAQQAQSGGTVDATLPTAQFPYNPSDLAWQVTQHALASMPQFGPAAATPAPVAVGGPQFGR